MARFLSGEWFDEVRSATTERASSGPPDLVLEQHVTGGPDGEVHYQVVLRHGRVTLEPGRHAPADLTFTSDYGTAAAVATAEMSTQAALMAGRIKVSGDLARLDRHQGALHGLDPVPVAVRASTTY